MKKYLGFEPTKNEDYVFLSFKHDDDIIVSKLALKLYEQGVAIWYDIGIEHGVNFQEYISLKISSSKCMIHCFSKKTLIKNKDEDSWPVKEVKTAKHLGIKTYFFMIDEIDDEMIANKKNKEYAIYLTEIKEKEFIPANNIQRFIATLKNNFPSVFEDRNGITYLNNEKHSPAIDEDIDILVKSKRTNHPIGHLVFTLCLTVLYGFLIFVCLSTFYHLKTFDATSSIFLMIIAFGIIAIIVCNLIYFCFFNRRKKYCYKKEKILCFIFKAIEILFLTIITLFYIYLVLIIVKPLIQQH